MAIISTRQTKSCYVWKNYLYFDLNVVYVFKSLLPSANGATRSEKGLFLKWICRISNTYPNFLVLAIHYFAAPLRSVLLVQALEQFPVPTERSGTLLTIMGTPLEHCNFSSHSLFPRSAPLGATIIRTFPSSYGAERNAFDTDGKHHLNIAISLAIHYFPAPLRSVPQSLVQALEQFPVPTERSGTLLDGNTTWTLQLL